MTNESHLLYFYFCFHGQRKQSTASRISKAAKPSLTRSCFLQSGYSLTLCALCGIRCSSELPYNLNKIATCFEEYKVVTEECQSYHAVVLVKLHVMLNQRLMWISPGLFFLPPEMNSVLFFFLNRNYPFFTAAGKQLPNYSF